LCACIVCNRNLVIVASSQAEEDSFYLEQIMWYPP
jgi:hypothetical protein